MLLALLPALTGCGSYDYSAHLSEVRSDLFVAETEEFTVTLACIEREHPYELDGVACPMSSLAEIVLTEKNKTDREYTVTVLGDKAWGGDMSYRSVRGDWMFSQGVESFPEGSVSLRVCWDGGESELTATSVKNENTLTAEQALEKAIEAERERVDALTYDGSFHGEFQVRLLRRDKNYYFVGICPADGKLVSLLLDSETGEVLARRAPD